MHDTRREKSAHVLRFYKRFGNEKTTKSEAEKRPRKAKINHIILYAVYIRRKSLIWAFS